MSQPNRQRGETAIAALVVLGTLAALLFGTAAITNDGPQHAYAADIVCHWGDGKYPDLWEHNAPISANGPHQLLVALCVAGVPTREAALVLWAALALAIAASAAWFVTTLSRQLVLAPIAVLLAFQTATVAGLIPFMCAQACMFVVMALEARGAWIGVRRHAILALLLATICWMHVHPAAMGGVCMIALRIDRGGYRSIAPLCMAGTPACLLALAAIGIGARDVGVQESAPLFDFSVISAGQGVIDDAPFLGVFVLALALVASLRSFSRHRMLAITTIMLLAAALAFHDDAFTWQLMRQRFPPFAVVCGLAIMTIPSQHTRRALALSMTLWLLGTCAFVYQSNVTRQTFGPPRAALAQLAPRGDNWAALVTSLPDGGQWRGSRNSPWFHLSQDLAMDIGGAPMRSQDSWSRQHHILRRTHRADRKTNTPSPGLWPSLWSDDGNRESRLAGFAAWGATTDGYLAYVQEGDIAVFSEAGHEIVSRLPTEDGHYAIATRFVGCSVDVSVPPEKAGAAISLGFFPAIEPVMVAEVPASGAVRFERAPCGPNVWIIASDLDCGPRDRLDRVRITERSVVCH